MDVKLLVAEMNKAFDIYVDSLRDFAKTLSKRSSKQNHTIDSRMYEFQDIWHIKEDIIRADFAHFYI